MCGGQTLCRWSNETARSSYIRYIKFNIFFGEIIRQLKAKFHAEGLQRARVIFRRKGVTIAGKEFKEGDSDVEFERIYEALFADDLVLFAASAEELQRMIDIFDDIVRQFGLAISVPKTKVMIVQVKNGLNNNDPAQPRRLNVGNEELEIVQKFK